MFTFTVMESLYVIRNKIVCPRDKAENDSLITVFDVHNLIRKMNWNGFRYSCPSPMLYKPHVITVKKKCTTQAPTKGWHHISQHMYHKYHDGYAVIDHLYLWILFILTAQFFTVHMHLNMCRLVISLIYFRQSCLTTKEWSVDLWYPAFCNLNLSTTVLVIFVNLLWSGHTLIFSIKDLPTCTMPYLYTAYLSVMHFCIYTLSQGYGLQSKKIF